MVTNPTIRKKLLTNKKIFFVNNLCQMRIKSRDGGVGNYFTPPSVMSKIVQPRPLDKFLKMPLTKYETHEALVNYSLVQK